MTTGIELYRDLAVALAESAQDVVTGIASDHTTTSLTDGIDLYYSSADATTYDRKFIYLEALGEQSRITEGGLSTAGVFTLSPAVTDAPTVPAGSAANVTTTATTLTDTDETMTVNAWIGYTVYAGGQTLDVTSNTATVLTGTGGWSYGGAGPGAVVWTVGTRYIVGDHRIQILRRAINTVLRNMYVPCFFPLSLHICTSDDNDMETDPAATFDATKVNAILTNDTGTVFNGNQSLLVAASSDGGYTHLGIVGVNEGEPLYAAIMCYVTTGDSATFRIIDVTNSNATIEDATSDEPKWMEMVFPFTVPSGCERIHARVISDTALDGSRWDDYQIWRAGQGVYPGPSWLTRPSQMNSSDGFGIRAFPHGTGGPASDNDYRTNERMSVPLRWHVEREDMRGDNPLHLWVEGTGGARPYIYALRPLSELASDSAITPADKDKVIDLAADLIRNPEEGYKRLRDHVAATLARPDTHVSPRVGVSIR